MLEILDAFYPRLFNQANGSKKSLKAWQECRQRLLDLLQDALLLSGELNTPLLRLCFDFQSLGMQQLGAFQAHFDRKHARQDQNPWKAPHCLTVALLLATCCAVRLTCNISPTSFCMRSSFVTSTL